MKMKTMLTCLMMNINVDMFSDEETNKHDQTRVETDLEVSKVLANTDDSFLRKD